MNIPAHITVGDSVTWTDAATVDREGDRLDSASWNLTYSLRTNTAAEGATVAGVADGNGGWDFSILAATTAGFSTGTWHWQATASEIAGDGVLTICAGTLTVAANLAYTGTPGAYDGRTQAEQDLAAVQAQIRSIVSSGVSQYAIGSRQATKLRLDYLMAREKDLQRVVTREKAARCRAEGTPDPRDLYVRFTR